MKKRISCSKILLVVLAIALLASPSISATPEPQSKQAKQIKARFEEAALVAKVKIPNGAMVFVGAGL